MQAKIGKAAYVSLPCPGSGGNTLGNSITTLSVSNVLSTGAAVDTAVGGLQDDGSTLAKLTSTVSNVKLLNSLITAQTVTAVAQETYTSGVRNRSAAGSGFVGLKVAGLPINVNVAPNTQLSLPGFGHVIVNEQLFPTNDRTQVNGLHIFVDTSNILGLPVGSEIIVAHAIASATKF